MKSIDTHPSTAAATSPGLIKDVPVQKASGKDIGHLVAGKGVGTDFSRHEAHWRGHHSRQTFSEGHAFEAFHPAYRVGYEGYARFGMEGKNFEETETKLRERYETEDGSPKLPWTVVRPASHAAWHRAAEKINRPPAR